RTDLTDDVEGHAVPSDHAGELDRIVAGQIVEAARDRVASGADTREAKHVHVAGGERTRERHGGARGRRAVVNADLAAGKVYRSAIAVIDLERIGDHVSFDVFAEVEIRGHRRHATGAARARTARACATRA